MGLDGFHIEKPAMGLRLLEIAGELRIHAVASSSARLRHADSTWSGRDES
jgi:hypothetical protein